MSRTALISGATKGIGELRTVDLSDRDATSSALQDISSTNRIDAVVNNVGLVRRQTLEQVTLDALDAVLDVNLRTAVQLTQAALPGMRQQGWGRVVNIVQLDRYLDGLKLDHGGDWRGHIVWGNSCTRGLIEAVKRRSDVTLWRCDRTSANRARLVRTG
jgi:hypothetical protein